MSIGVAWIGEGPEPDQLIVGAVAALSREYALPVNTRLTATPGVATHAPYGAGWLVEMSPAEQGFRTLPRAAAARQWFDSEAARLQLALDRAREISAADGGISMVPPGHLLSDQQFEQLAAELLQAAVVKA